MEIATDWVMNLLTRVSGEGAKGVRCNASFRVKRPSGVLTSIKVYSGSSVSNTTIQIERTALSAGDPSVPVVMPHEDEGSPFITAFEKAIGTKLTIATVPVSNAQGLWGAICIGYEGTDLQFDIPSRILRIAARVVNDQLLKQDRPGIVTVIETNPRALLPLTDFLNNVDLLLACSPKGSPGVVLLVYALRARIETENSTVHALARNAALRILDNTRIADLTSIYESDTILIALPCANEATCAKVSERIRDKLNKNLPKAAKGGFAYEVLDATMSCSDDMLKKLVVRARAAAAPIE